tara:strand:+ start:284 stop:532 length:249 start_codon:yes stop_codon:yes gene_type:complete
MKKVISETIEETRHFRMKVPHEGTPISPEIKNFKAHKAYRERLRQMMVVPAPSVDQKESTGWKRHSGVPNEVVDLVSDTDDD